jgi:hypothetical protein
VFFFSSAFAPLSLLRRMEQAGLLPFPFPPLGSVGVAAVHAALAMTGENVFVTGLDFGYPEGRTHARGSPAHLAMLCSCRRCRPAGQDAYAAILSRHRVREADKRGRPLLTDAILRSYRDALARRLETDAGRVRDAGLTGLPFGAAAVTSGELSDLLAAAPRAGERLLTRHGETRQKSVLRSFLDAEMHLLDEADGLVVRLLASAAGRAAPAPAAAQAPGASPAGASPAEGITAAESSLLASVDYAYAHFPDQPGPGTPSRSFLARALIALRYYSRRLERLRGGRAGGVV